MKRCKLANERRRFVTSAIFHALNSHGVNSRFQIFRIFHDPLSRSADVHARKREVGCANFCARGSARLIKTLRDGDSLRATVDIFRVRPPDGIALNIGEISQTDERGEVIFGCFQNVTVIDDVTHDVVYRQIADERVTGFVTYVSDGDSVQSRIRSILIVGILHHPLSLNAGVEARLLVRLTNDSRADCAIARDGDAGFVVSLRHFEGRWICAIDFLRVHDGDGARRR
mmetsp:Transcript_5447/g.21307  ORF Transcript_5447/g.21307 Transcript_5447/m.21307 type:complete len:228 (-) Transcript_5447:6392-7075(-)